VSWKNKIRRKNSREDKKGGNDENEKIEFSDLACEDETKCEIFPRLLHLMDVRVILLSSRISEQGKKSCAVLIWCAVFIRCEEVPGGGHSGRKYFQNFINTFLIVF
jgi:hypothetical protein